MSWLSWLVGKDNVVSTVVDKVSKGADELHFSGEEKAKDTAAFETEITKRWTADKEAPITRLVRPVSYLFVTVVTFTFGALDASLESFKIEEIYKLACAIFPQGKRNLFLKVINPTMQFLMRYR